MASNDEDELVDRTLRSLSEEGEPQDDEERQALEELAERVEEPGLQDEILRRYLGYGRQLLSDSVPVRLDQHVVDKLEPLLGDVSNVRVHTGKAATEAAEAMDARAFAIGDEDVFVHEREFDPSSSEGTALLAHEIAHTRDAATGFAMSSRHGDDSSDREAFPRAVEMELARDDTDTGDEGQGESQRAASEATSPRDKAEEPKVDRRELERRVMEILHKQERLQRERHGR